MSKETVKLLECCLNQYHEKGKPDFRTVTLNAKQVQDCLEAFKSLEKLETKENEQWARRLIAEVKHEKALNELADLVSEFMKEQALKETN